jgi:phosphomannomutase
MSSPTVEELRARAAAWSAADPDPETAREIRELLASGADDELLDRFGTALDFGTAGLRGLLGGGPNRMNRAVVRRATAGLARYLKRSVVDAAGRGVVVGRDARRMSREFAEDAAAVLAAEGIPALYFAEPVPTPLTAYAVKELSAAGGVMITASHNPPAYNGYKVYWENGAQIIPPHDRGIAAAIDAVEPPNRVPLLAESEARRAGLWRNLPDEVKRSYLRAVDRERAHPEIRSELKIAYTALHGVGGRLFEEAMAAAGVRGVSVVAEQHAPDPAFPTVAFPNPEEPGAMDRLRALAERVGADLGLANDPDADRLAVLARSADGRLQQLTGNEVGVLLGHYLLTQPRQAGQDALVISTIVSSAQLGHIARELGVRYDETLTGFKWIANRAMERERAEGLRFVFGYEEALGYTVGQVVRDKDGVGAAVAFADLASWCRSRGITPLDYLEEIQRRFGIYSSSQRSVAFPGPAGARAMAAIMEAFRRHPPEQIGQSAVVSIKDYGTGKAVSRGQSMPIQLPSSNVIAYELAGESRVTLRPSGTEPKIKYYFEVKESLKPGEPLELARQRLQQKLRQLEDVFLALAKERAHFSQT